MDVGHTVAFNVWMEMRWKEMNEGRESGLVTKIKCKGKQKEKKKKERKKK